MRRENQENSKNPFDLRLESLYQLKENVGLWLNYCLAFINSIFPGHRLKFFSDVLDDGVCQLPLCARLSGETEFQEQVLKNLYEALDLLTAEGGLLEKSVLFETHIRRASSITQTLDFGEAIVKKGKFDYFDSLKWLSLKVEYTIDKHRHQTITLLDNCYNVAFTYYRANNEWFVHYDAFQYEADTLQEISKNFVRSLKWLS